MKLSIIKFPFICSTLLILLILLITLVPNSSYCSEKSEKIVIEGNKRTTNNHILFLIERCKKNNDLTLKQCLMNSRLFSSVEITSSKGRKQTEITIKVKERWTLIPIPEIKLSSDNKSFGAFIIESNFLGIGKMLFIGAKTGNVEKAFFFFYKDRNLFYSELTADAFFSKGSRNLKTYDKKDILYAFKESSQNISLRFGNNISHDLSANLGIQQANITYNEELYYHPPANYNFLSIGPELSYNQSNYKLYFNQGYSFRLNYLHQIHRSDNESKSAKIEYSFIDQNNIYSNHVFQFRFSGMNLINSNLRDSIKTGGNIGYRGVQSGGLWLKSSQNLSIDYLIPFSTPNYGTWVLAPFTDYCMYKAYFNNHTDFLSTGIGSYLYLKNIALPGLGLVLGINKKFLNNFVSFSMGMGF
ncbi:MAG: hypothetical protein HQK51_03415 [Oligoflexia bacterium]|nr:hypothetical protein [Oligoflexia bacterium]